MQSDAAHGDKDSHAYPVDQATTALVSYFAGRVSRRGILAKFGKLLLIAFGVTTMEVLPVGNNEVAAANCNDWTLCGIYGRTCDCCNGGQPLNYCPAGTSWYSYWTACCYAYGDYYRFNYWDCCGGNVDCSSCTWCYNNSPQPAWCNQGEYRCTAVVSQNTVC